MELVHVMLNVNSVKSIKFENSVSKLTCVFKIQHQ